MAVCVAIIGKNNAPRFFSCLDSDNELELQYEVHAALDVVEERLSAVKDSKELYLGQLYSTETYKIFGYVTNTKVKFIIVINSSSTTLRDNEVRTMFKRLHSLYSNAICNPFCAPGDEIISKKFSDYINIIVNGNAVHK